MFSWIFRHRHRLRLIYGPQEVPPALPAASAPRPAPPPNRANAGRIARRSRYVVVVPMPRGGFGGYEDDED